MKRITVVTGLATHLSPTENSLTFRPMAETTPTISCPGISCTRGDSLIEWACIHEPTGNVVMNSPSCTCPSVTHTPDDIDERSRYVSIERGSECLTTGNNFPLIEVQHRDIFIRCDAHSPFRRTSSSPTPGIGTCFTSNSLAFPSPVLAFRHRF